MSVRTTTTTVYICDRCGFESTDEFARGAASSITEQFGMVAYDGATGGATRNFWLCGRCAIDFGGWVKNEQQVSIAQVEAGAFGLYLATFSSDLPEAQTREMALRRWTGVDDRLQVKDRFRVQAASVLKAAGFDTGRTGRGN